MEEPRKTKRDIPLGEKLLLTVEEAARYSGIGMNKIKEMSNAPHCNFVLFNGNKRLIKRKELEEYIGKNRVI